MGGKMKIVAQMIVISHLPGNYSKKQSYKRVPLCFLRKGNSSYMRFDIKKSKTIISLKESTCYTRKLESHGLLTISLQNPRKDYMIKTNLESDNYALLQFFKRRSSKSGRNYSLNTSENDQHIKILANKLNVLPDALLKKQVDLSKRSLNVLPKGFGDLKLRELNIACNLFGSNMNYWSWVWGNIRLTLQTLSLVDNKLTKFPLEVLSLCKLKELDLSENDLKEIPLSLFCSHRKLSWLSLKGNSNLQYLPKCMKQLLFLNIVDCPKLHQASGGRKSKYLASVPSLKRIAGKTVLQSRQSYTSSLPWTLITYLDDHFDCWHCMRCVPLPSTTHTHLLHRPSLALETRANYIEINSRFSFCGFCSHNN